MQPSKFSSIVIGSVVLTFAAALPGYTQSTRDGNARLSGHVIPALTDATHIGKNPTAATEPLTLTVTLNFSDSAGFEAFGKEFDDPASPNFHHPISAEEVTARFGPTAEVYSRLVTYFQQQGFTVVRRSADRLTLTVRGARSQAERIFNVSIEDYRLGDREFYANVSDPLMPENIRQYVRSVSGLSNLSRPHLNAAPTGFPASIASAYNAGGLPPGINGAGQTIGLIEFDNFQASDVSNWLALAGLPPNLINQVTAVPVNGGTGPSGCTPVCGETEVLLDIDAALGTAPGAQLIVFAAPNGTDNITMISAAINGVRAVHGSYGGIISTSWNQCEREVSDSDLDSMEALLQNASYSGMTVFASSGDYGATCVSLGGRYANRVAYPSAAPHAVSVGGTNIQVDAAGRYQSENWWDASFDNGQIGTSGYGYSWHFGEPNYQTPFVSASGRSVPDVSAEAGDGILVCQASAAVSPNCLGVGGTSLAAPLWAGMWALASQELTLNTGLNGVAAAGGYLYTIPQAFHPASSMTGPGNDFAHLGLGSPDIAKLVAAVAGKAQVTGISPGFGPASGGTAVTISGHGFVGVTQVLFGGLVGVPAASFRVLSESQIQAVTPSCLTDYCSQFATSFGHELSLVAAAGNSQPTQVGFRFLPGVTAVTPSSGTMDGGTAVTVSGSGFGHYPFPTFYFGGVPALNVTCSSSTQCTMLSPAENPGTVDVYSAGLDLGAHFTFTGPAITRISPAAGAEIGGTYVNIFGTSLSNNMVVRFGTTQAGSPLCEGNTWCTVYSPPGTGSVHITATRAGMTTAATFADWFTYEPLPYGTLTPDNGPDTGGTLVFVNGGNFDPRPGATQFIFSVPFSPDVPATGVTCSSAGLCSFVTPPCALGAECYISPYAVVKAIIGGVTTPIYGFTYNITSEPPSPPPPVTPPCNPKRPTTCM